MSASETSERSTCSKLMSSASRLRIDFSLSALFSVLWLLAAVSVSVLVLVLEVVRGFPRLIASDNLGIRLM